MCVTISEARRSKGTVRDTVSTPAAAATRTSRRWRPCPSHAAEAIRPATMSPSSPSNGPVSRAVPARTVPVSSCRQTVPRTVSASHPTTCRTLGAPGRSRSSNSRSQARSSELWLPSSRPPTFGLPSPFVPVVDVSLRDVTAPSRGWRAPSTARTGPHHSRLQTCRCEVGGGMLKAPDSEGELLQLPPLTRPAPAEPPRSSGSPGCGAPAAASR